MEITTTTGIVCPHCRKEWEINTKGIFGGIFAQSITHSFIRRLKREGGTVTCGSCKCEFNIKSRWIS
jgi:hypothetical protein